MRNVPTATTATTPEIPSLPPSAKALLADPFSLGDSLATWEPPNPSMTPARRDIEAWITTLKKMLEPASGRHVGFLVTTMANSMAMRNGQTQQMASRTDGWQLACGLLPADLWTEGCMELLRTKTFMPAPGELMAIVGGKFEERRRMLQRASTLLGASTADAKPRPPAPKPIGQIDRLRKILAEQRARTDLTEEHRLFAMAHTERSLAMFEKRPMEPWAREFFDAREAAPATRSQVGAVARAVVRDTMRASEQAAVQPWQSGAPVYQQRQEEPPPPTEILEGDDANAELEP